ncbi:MAG TPA: DUF484 family protein [Pseudomonas sabulinigri]|uniref:DUF484 family protein n=1 Tax=marine sediment metagenome TaxID=412755 RepID=A0A0F9VBK9_9ZZZZ|nr:DUF484 family protein [Halopseudomonas sabulinigri]HEC52491.1 DUF484 family protein [Halopseudomonas sabulinigri]|tara:strand:- start:1026 stop:1730 length:705 start_codon:yes stop_codon:yes gene_type:complete
MSEQKPQSSEEIDAEQVAEYLRRHPAFFAEHDELLADLIIPHQRGQAVSLVERQVKLLRERNIDVRHRLNQLMDTARENDRLFDKSRRLILGMLEAQSLDQVVASLEDSLRNDFQIPFVCLILFTEADRYSNAHCVTHTEAKAAIGHLLDNGKPVSGALRPDELRFLFGDDGEEVASTAFAPISHQGLHGVLALGSKDAQQYRSATGTLFLGYVADALARILLRQRPMADEAHA